MGLHYENFAVKRQASDATLKPNRAERRVNRIATRLTSFYSESTHEYARKTKSGCALKTECMAKVAKMLPLESKEKRRDYEAFTNHATNDYLSVSARWQAYEVSLGVLAGIVPRNNLSRASKKEYPPLVAGD